MEAKYINVENNTLGAHLEPQSQPKREQRAKQTPTTLSGWQEQRRTTQLPMWYSLDLRGRSVMLPEKIPPFPGMCQGKKALAPVH